MNMRHHLRGNPGSDGRGSIIAAVMSRSAIVLSIIGLGAGFVTGPATAQQPAADVAYVETVSGRVVAFARGAPVLLSNLDVIGNRTRLDLLAQSELRVCHYGAQRFLTLKGPARFTISTDGVATEGGKSIEASAEPCAAPTISKHQGGLLTRGSSRR
jgi:hypothetical protein